MDPNGFLKKKRVFADFFFSIKREGDIQTSDLHFMSNDRQGPSCRPLPGHFLRGKGLLPFNIYIYIYI
jgi:hypothetical protein